MVLIQEINYNYLNRQPLLQFTKNEYDSISILSKSPEYITESVLRKTSFMSNLKKYLTDKAFYSIEECMRS
jgi:hypothetical protein